MLGLVLIGLVIFGLVLDGIHRNDPPARTSDVR
jgi:hypothetical protein